MITIKTFTCPYCQANTTFPIDSEQWARYERGELAQNAFPEMDAVIREVVISGICPSCQAELFDEDDVADHLEEYAQMCAEDLDIWWRDSIVDGN